MKDVFLNARRTVCERHIMSGEIFGSTAITITAPKTFDNQTILDATRNVKTQLLLLEERNG